MLSSVEKAFVGRDEKRAPLKTPALQAKKKRAIPNFLRIYCYFPVIRLVNFVQVAQLPVSKLDCAVVTFYITIKNRMLQFQFVFARVISVALEKVSGIQ